jgi:chromodomain-helicase-DNA-binding protein 4
LPYEHFDPSAAYVHPESRITPKSDSPVERTGQKSRHVEYDSEKSEEEEEEEEEDDDNKETDNYSTSDAGSPAIRTTRSGGRKRALPFSPRKTRSRGRTMSTDAASEYSDSPAPARPTRRSTRARVTRPAQDDESFNEDDDVSERSAPKRTVKRKAARPEYGGLRQVADLDDEDIAPLQAHYDTCSKCHQKRADLLLKKKGKKRRAEEGEMEPHELGGWVRWYVQISAMNKTGSDLR